jgi:hypothetical protein
MNVELREIMAVLCAALNTVILVWFQELIFSSLGCCKFLFVSWMHFIYFINGCYERHCLFSCIGQNFLSKYLEHFSAFIFHIYEYIQVAAKQCFILVWRLTFKNCKVKYTYTPM